MKLVTFTFEGATMAGALVGADRVVALSSGSDGRTSPGALAQLLASASDLARARSLLSRIEAGEDPGNDARLHRLEDVELLCPIPRPEKFIGIGLNYRDHAEEQNARIPSAPIVFAKFANSLIGPYQTIRYPRITEQLDYEAELGVVIGRPGRDIAAADAWDHVAGYCVINDVTARDVQLRDRQWVRGKTPDRLTPVGPAITTADEVADAGSLWVRLWINDELMQDSNTNQMIFDTAEIIAHVSQDITLETGDIIATGTPGGVGFVRDPAVFLEDGDVVAVEIQGLGRIENVVRRD